MAKAAGVTHRGPAAADEAEEPFEPLSDEELRRVIEEADRRYEKPSSQRRRLREQRRGENEFERMEREEGERRSRERGRARRGARNTAMRAASSSSALLRGRGIRSATKGPGGTIAGVALGLVATAIAVNVLDNGPAGVLDWLSAKFINKPRVGTGAPPRSPARPASPAGGSTPSSPQASRKVAA